MGEGSTGHPLGQWHRGRSQDCLSHADLAQDSPRSCALLPVAIHVAASHSCGREYELVRSLEHPNVIKYYELDDHSNPEKLYLFMELAAGTIATLLPEQEALPFTRDKFRQLLVGLAYLHGQGVAHHDIKPDNVLVVAPSGQVRISDFGVAERFEPGKGCCVFYGTPAYQAPEIAGNTLGTPYDGTKADMWSAGVLLYQLLLGRLPYTGDTVYLLLKAIECDPVPLASARTAGLADLLVDLLAHLLEKDPVKRYSAQEALQHPWLAGDDDLSPAGPVVPAASCCRVL